MTLIDPSKPPIVPQPAGGPFGAWNRTDLKKIAVGMVVVMVGAAATSGLEYIAGQDFGAWTPYVVAACSVAVNAIRKLLDTSKSTN